MIQVSLTITVDRDASVADVDLQVVRQFADWVKAQDMTITKLVIQREDDEDEERRRG